MVDDADGAQFLVDDVAAVDGADLDVGDARVERRPPVVDAQGPAQCAVGHGHRRQVLPLRGVGREHRPQPAHLPGALRHDVYRSVTALSESRSQAPEARRTSPNARARHEVIMLAKQRMRSSSTYLPTFVPSLEEITC